MAEEPDRPGTREDTGRQCPSCGEADLVEEHAHGRCPACGWRGACCW